MALEHIQHLTMMMMMMMMMTLMMTNKYQNIIYSGIKLNKCQRTRKVLNSL